MKKNNASLHRATGRNDSAYAAGVARTTTIRVENTLAISEFSRNGVMLLSNTLVKCSSVGVKNQTGGFVVTSLACFRLVSSIQMTGKTKMIPAIQATMPQTGLFRRRLTVTVLIGPPPP